MAVLFALVGCGSEPGGSGRTGPADAAAAADGATADALVDADVDAGIDCDADRPDLSSAPEDASWRYGGGHGYPDLAHPSCADAVVSTREELEAALAGAASGDLVYVDDDARIDLTGIEEPLCIPGGVTLASGRGRTSGALVYTTDVVRRAILDACGDDVRITGLRILGADPWRCPPGAPDGCGSACCRDFSPTSIGVRAFGDDGLEVDNCELAGWSLSAIRLLDSVDDHVHHNHIHHNNRAGLGYGVLLSDLSSSTPPVEVVVEHNRFDANRHAIAGSGGSMQSYDARFNLALPSASGHVFDMHGMHERSGYDDPWAGGRLRIHSNTVLPTRVQAVVIRGRPMIGAWIYDNCFSRSDATTGGGATWQRYFTGNYWVDESETGSAPNRYDQAPADCEAVRFCADTSSHGPIRYLGESALALADVVAADFDGDGRADLLRSTGASWEMRSGGLGDWRSHQTMGIPLAEVAFADVDGDGAADAFTATGTEWRVSRGASNAWETLRAAPERLSQLSFGDFDGDGRADAFSATGTEWRISRGASNAWEPLRAAPERLSQLAFGDFDDDGRTDVFYGDGAEWWVSDGGTAAPRRLIGSSLRAPDLRIADVDGDGRADVLRRDALRWYVSLGGVAPWSEWAIRSEGFDEVHFADFDGDGSADTLRAGCL